MRVNLESGGGRVVAERISFALSDRLGRRQAHDLVAEAARASSFREALLADERVAWSDAELDALLDPAGYLGSAEALVDRALAEWDRSR